MRERERVNQFDIYKWESEIFNPGNDVILWYITKPCLSLLHFDKMLQQRLSSRISKTLNHVCSAYVVPKHSFTALSSQPNLQKLQQRVIPGDFVRWGSLGFCRTSSFATGFSPLQHKPLDSIMDVQRVKDRSPEDIASAWDDVMSLTKTPNFFILFCLLWILVDVIFLYFFFKWVFFGLLHEFLWSLCVID